MALGARGRWLLAVMALALVAACSDDDAAVPPPTTEPAAGVTVASFGFDESEILANIYGKALEAGGVDVDYKLRLGTREIVIPAAEKGEVDLVPEYAGNLLAYYDAAASTPGDDLAATIAKLRERAKAKKLRVLEPARAADGDVIAMTRATASRLGVSRISDLLGREGDLVFGGPPECPQRITCYRGLQQVYGLRFKDFRALDTAGPITVRALKEGDVDVARLFASDPAIISNDLVVLVDDKSIQPAGNVVPVIREDALVGSVESILDRVSAALTTQDLVELNGRVDIGDEDPAAAAAAWLADHGLD